MIQNQEKDLKSELSGGLILACAAALLYCLTLSRHHTADSLLYALAIEGGELQALVDPTHLFLHPLGLLWYRAWQAVGWTGRSLMPLQVFNALAGAICVGLLWAVARALSRSAIISTIIALGFAISGGLWLLSVEAEFVTFPLAMQLLTLWWILGAWQRYSGRTWYAITLGLLVTLAIFVYATSVFLILVVLAGFFTAELDSNTRRRQIFAFFLAISLAAIPVLLMIFAVWVKVDIIPLPQIHGQGSYGQLTWFNIPHGVYAFLRSLGLFPGLVMNDSTKELLLAADQKLRLSFFTYYGLVTLLVLLPLIYLLSHWRKVWANAKRTVLVLGAWSIPFVVFAFYWVPGDITFWMPLLAAWWLSVALCFSVSRSTALTAGALLVVLLLGFVNAEQTILPRTVLESNQAYKIAQYVADETEEQDTILITADDLTLLTVFYFSERHVIPVQEPIIARENLPSWIAKNLEDGGNYTGRLFMLETGRSLQELR